MSRYPKLSPIRASCAARREEGLEDEKDSNLINFANFNDYNVIIGDNKNIFSPYLINLRLWQNRLKEIEPIRNAINTLTGAYENEETRTRWVNSSNTEFLYSYSGNTILSVPALRMGDYVFWNAVKSTLEDMRYLCWYRTANNIVPSSCHDYLFEDMTYSEAWNEAYTYGTNSIYDEQIAYWHMAAGIVVQINAGAYIHVDVGTTAQRGTCRLWKISRTWTHTDVVSAIGVESLAWNASDNVTMTASGSGTDVINGVVGRALLQTMFYGPLSWLSPFDNAPGHAELGIVYGLVNDLSNITKTCVFTELEVGTHLTYG